METLLSYKGVFDSTIGIGKTPALLSIDFVNAYTDPDAPLYAPAVVEAVHASVPLFEKMRNLTFPIIHTRVEYDEEGLTGGIFVRKVPILRKMVKDAWIAQIVETLTPRRNEPVLTKQYASAFFGTSLASTLTALHVDTTIIVGCSTSGCVRATAVDAMQHGFRVIIPKECVGDRAEDPHHANLFDIHSKYGDVCNLSDVLQSLDTV